MWYPLIDQSNRHTFLHERDALSVLLRLRTYRPTFPTFSPVRTLSWFACGLLLLYIFFSVYRFEAMLHLYTSDFHSSIHSATLPSRNTNLRPNIKVLQPLSKNFLCVHITQYVVSSLKIRLTRTFIHLKIICSYLWVIMIFSRRLKEMCELDT